MIYAFCDPSGGGADSFTMALARPSIFGHKAVLLGMWEFKPPFSPDMVVEEYAAILRAYGVTTVVGDRYAAGWVVERFAVHGITYVESKKTESEVFAEFLALVNSRRVKIPHNRRLRAQLLGMERHTSRSGRDSVDHQPGGHDDLANCVAGALCLAAQRRNENPFLAEWIPFDRAEAFDNEEDRARNSRANWQKLN